MYITFIETDSTTNNKEIKTIITRSASKKNIENLEKIFHNFNYLYEEALKTLENIDIPSMYKTVYISKKNGSKRRIDIPNDDLKAYQNKVVDIFSKKLSLIFPKSVYGYVPGRNAKSMAEKHKGQYLVVKLDIKNFFPNCTYNFIMNSMSEVYPFSLLQKELLETILLPCMVFYDGEYRLPQGAPTSPILSNIAMIPIDYELQSYTINSSNNYTYTRFADDIIISDSKSQKTSNIKYFKEINEKNFVRKVINNVNDCFNRHNQNFTINSKKTKVLNTDCGNVWMLGVTVGKNVKLGNQRKQRLKATLWSFLNDCKNGKTWSNTDTRHMLGILGYAKYIEPNFVNELIAKYEQKTKMNFKKEVNKILCS